jgi:hypothetical protein
MQNLWQGHNLNASTSPASHSVVTTTSPLFLATLLPLHHLVAKFNRTAYGLFSSADSNSGDYTI